jgi:hypothetical protein
MMLLNQNQENTVYLSLSDSIVGATGTPVYFLFEFVSLTTNDHILFTAPNISSALTRYDEFHITLTGASYQNFTAGTISMNPAGEWIYNVYTQYSPTNISLNNIFGTVIERGIITLSGTPNTYITQSYTGTNQTYSYYEG